MMVDDHLDGLLESWHKEAEGTLLVSKGGVAIGPVSLLLCCAAVGDNCEGQQLALPFCLLNDGMILAERFAPIL